MRSRVSALIDRSDRFRGFLVGAVIALAALVLVCWLAGPAAGQTCDQTLLEGQDVQSAINSASNGDTICFTPGLWTPGATILVNKRLTLRGPQAGVDPRPICSLRTAGDPASEAILDGGNFLVTILQIEANDVVIDGLEIRSGTGDLIHSLAATPVERPVIRYCIIHDSWANEPWGLGDEGIQLRNAMDAVIEYNDVWNTAGDGINLCCGSTGGMIRFNEVHDIYSPDAAIYIYDGTSVTDMNVTILGNRVHDVYSNDGIKVGSKEGRDATDRGGVVFQNRVYDTLQDGITVYTSNTLVECNEVYRSRSVNGAVYVSYGVSGTNVLRNDIHDNGFTLNPAEPTWGIRIGKDGYYPGNTLVSGNCIQRNEAGLYYNAGPPANEQTLNAESNWWGDESGPGLVGPGSGDTVSLNVDFDPWLRSPDGCVCEPIVECGDECPEDPDKVVPGICGCGFPDTDSDGDGVPDCIDPCPDDPDKVHPGACGCGVPDTDSDGDGTADCIDGCPDDPAKVHPGTCGCGMPETDGNGNTIPDCIELRVTIDIQPGSTVNPVNYKKRGVIPVAILSSATFNAVTEVNRLTLRFGRTGNEPSLIVKRGVPQCAAEDIAPRDGRPDLVCQYDSLKAGFRPGDTIGTLTGWTWDNRFLHGQDRVTPVP